MFDSLRTDWKIERKKPSSDLNGRSERRRNAHHDNCKRNFNESEVKENGEKASNETKSEPEPAVPLAN
jgi:hypothetical protein